MNSQENSCETHVLRSTKKVKYTNWNFPLHITNSNSTKIWRKNKMEPTKGKLVPRQDTRSRASIIIEEHKLTRLNIHSRWERSLSLLKLQAYSTSEQWTVHRWTISHITICTVDTWHTEFVFTACRSLWMIMMPLFIGTSHCLHDKFGGHDSSFRRHFQDSTTPVQPASNCNRKVNRL